MDPRESICQGCGNDRFTSLRCDTDGRSQCGLQPFRVERRQVIFVEGTPATHVHFVKSGAVRTYCALPDGRPQGVRVVGANGLVGLDGLATGAHRTTAETITPAVICSLSIADLRRRCESDAKLSADLCAYLIEETAALHDRLHDLGVRRSRSKVAACLLALEGAVDGILQRDLAELVGVAPETVCRVIGWFRADGLVETHAHGVRVRDAAALRAIAGGA